MHGTFALYPTSIASISEGEPPERLDFIGRKQVLHQQDTGARYVVSACQQCMRTLFNGARKNKIRVRAVDVSQIVLESVENAG